MTNKCKLIPEYSSFSAKQPQGLLSAMLEGGCSRQRADIIGVWPTVNVQWTVSGDDYAYLQQLWTWSCANGHPVFELDMKLHDDQLRTYGVKLLKDSFRVSSVSGVWLTISAQLEVDPTIPVEWGLASSFPGLFDWVQTHFEFWPIVGGTPVAPSGGNSTNIIFQTFSSWSPKVITLRAKLVTRDFSIVGDLEDTLVSSADTTAFNTDACHFVHNLGGSGDPVPNLVVSGSNLEIHFDNITDINAHRGGSWYLKQQTGVNEGTAETYIVLFDGNFEPSGYVQINYTFNEVYNFPEGP